MLNHHHQRNDHNNLRVHNIDAHGFKIITIINLYVQKELINQLNISSILTKLMQIYISYYVIFLYLVVVVLIKHYPAYCQQWKDFVIILFMIGEPITSTIGSTVSFWAFWLFWQRLGKSKSNLTLKSMYKVNKTHFSFLY